MLQAPSPDLSTGAFQAGEALMILPRLGVLAACLEAPPVPAEASAPEVNVKPRDPLSAWLRVGCAGMAAVVVWMGLTWAAAPLRRAGDGHDRVFLPPVLLAFFIYVGKCRRHGRQAELDEFIAQRIGGDRQALRRPCGAECEV